MVSEVGLKAPPPPLMFILAKAVATQPGCGEGLALGEGLGRGVGLCRGVGLALGEGLGRGVGLALGEGLGRGVGLGVCAGAVAELKTAMTQTSAAQQKFLMIKFMGS